MVKAAGQLAQRRRNAPESDRGERQWRATAARSSTRGPMSMVAMRMCLSSMKIQRGKMEGEVSHRHRSRASAPRDGDRARSVTPFAGGQWRTATRPQRGRVRHGGRAARTP